VGEKPDYAGLLTFAGVPYTQDAAHLDGVDVAIVGAPMDDLVSDRPGTRFGPRAIRAASSPSGPELETGIDAISELRVVDFGDAPVLPADPVRSHAAIEDTVAQVLAAGAIPLIIGGDHSITEPNVRACAAHGPVGLVHFDTHTDTGTEVFGVELSHGTIMRRLVEESSVDPQRYVQIGLRGYWPGQAEFAWQAEQGISSFFMYDVRDLGIGEVVHQAVEVGRRRTHLPHRGHRRPGSCLRAGHGDAGAWGMSTAELLWAVREVAAQLEVIGADVVEVIPTGVGSADVTALAGDRIIREILGGIARHRREQTAGQPEEEEER